MENKAKKKKRSKKKFLLIIPIIFLFLFGLAAGAYIYINDKIQLDTDNTKIFTNPEDIKEAEADEEKGLINILLVGVDARPGEKIGRTDSIILATIDTNNKRVKLTSFMRDMYVEIPGHKNNKINAAYAMGGPELLIKTINHNFNFNIQYFASINFNGFQEVVDKLGGVNVDVQDYEVKEINKFIYEVNGSKATLLKGPGYQTLNGQQALSYSRIRKVGNNDYERTERQRRVLSVLLDKAKKTSLLKLPDLVTTMLPYIKTNIPTPKLLSIANTVYKFGSTPTDTLRLPGDRMFQSMNIPGSGDSLVPDLEKNVALLDQFIYSTGGAMAGNMPAYVANNFHANDISLDRRGKKKPVVKIEVPKPDPQVELIKAPVITTDPESGKSSTAVKAFIGGSEVEGVNISYEYKIGNGSWIKYDPGKVLTIDTSCMLWARAMDDNGNISKLTSKSIEIIKDTQPPKITLIKPGVVIGEQSIENGKPSVKVTITNENKQDSNSHIEISINNGSWVRYDKNIVEILIDSSCELKAVIIDDKGNSSDIFSRHIDIKTTTP